jgi:phosphatidylserine/phosphatidylglycerophosphate/cardiolipin synthase-like enzyme
MDNSFDKLSLLISEFIRSTPPVLVREIIAGLVDWKCENWDLSKAKLFSNIHNPHIKSGLEKIINSWQNENPQFEGVSMALAFNSALVTQNSEQTAKTNLVWTGPATANVPIRRTDQVLLELIEGAQQRLVVVSFAIYKAQKVIDAIEKAIRREVKVLVCLEDSSDKVAFPGIKAFSGSIFRLASFYTWPIENRPHSEDGNYGSLHAKLAVADREKAFITSANLTDYAMDMNLEMGVMVEDKELCEKLDGLFEELIVQKVFKKIKI